MPPVGENGEIGILAQFVALFESLTAEQQDEVLAELAARVDAALERIAPEREARPSDLPPREAAPAA